MAWTKLKDRHVYDFAVVSVAVAFTVDGAGKWADGRVVLGGVAPVPYRATVVETALKGQAIAWRHEERGVPDGPSGNDRGRQEVRQSTE